MKAFIFLLTVFIVIQNPIGLASSYSNIEYEGGYPKLNGHYSGTITLEADGIAFRSVEGWYFKVIYQDCAGYKTQQDSTGGHKTGIGPMALAGPNPYFFLGSLGVTALEQAIARRHDAKPRVTYYYTLIYQDPQGLHDIRFKVPSEDFQNRLNTDIQQAIYHYQLVQRMHQNDFNEPPPNRAAINAN